MLVCWCSWILQLGYACSKAGLHFIGHIVKYCIIGSNIFIAQVIETIHWKNLYCQTFYNSTWKMILTRVEKAIITFTKFLDYHLISKMTIWQYFTHHFPSFFHVPKHFGALRLILWHHDIYYFDWLVNIQSLNKSKMIITAK